MKTLVISDIHGCYLELQELIELAALSADDEMIALGDIVDRGPDSPRVLEFFRAHPRARVIQGNHERKHIRGLQGELKLSPSQKITRIQFGDAYKDAVAFMETFPLSIELDEAILVHGYFEPGVPLAQQRETVLTGTMGGDKYLEGRYKQKWYELYDGAKPIIVGHHNYSHSAQPFIYQDRVFGLDTDVHEGKALTGIVLPEFRIVSVPSHANHWRELKKQFRIPARETSARSPAIWDEESQVCADLIFDRVWQEHERLIAHLRANSSYAELTPREQGRLYTEAMGRNTLIGLLHMARLGTLTREDIRTRLRRPESAKRLARRLGLWSPPESNSPAISE